MESFKTKYVFIILFTLAMAFLETTVVVYLRELYYPGGFEFPLKIMDYKIGQVEFLREFATLVMIFTFAWLTGKHRTEKFGIFLIVFAVWDIFYYIYLLLILSWPASLATWDILFLIPFTWVGPVWAPLLNSITMIALAAVLIFKRNKFQLPVMKASDWIYLIVGALIIIGAYTEDYISYLLNYISVGEIMQSFYKPETLKLVTTYIPRSFSLIVFLIGVAIHVGVIARIFVRRQPPQKRQAGSH